MHYESSDFFASCGRNSQFIYVFFGTTNKSDCNVVERYNSRDDLWEIIKVKVDIPVSLFNTFCIVESH